MVTPLYYLLEGILKLNIGELLKVVNNFDKAEQLDINVSTACATPVLNTVMIAYTL